MKNWHLLIRGFSKHELICLIELLIKKLELSDKVIEEIVINLKTEA